MHEIWLSAHLEPGALPAVYRNIATCYPSQDLFDDLVDDDQITTLQRIDSATSGIDHQLPAKCRTFQYRELETSLFVFSQPSWWGGRFSDGSYGVWYGALEEETSIAETLYWSARFVEPDLRNTKNPITRDRRLFQASLRHDCTADLRVCSAYREQLTDPTDYTFCRQIGREAVAQKAGWLLSPSARYPTGTCVPVFTPEAIVSEKTLAFVRFTHALGQDPVWVRSPPID
jgi:hypothetical protein